MKKQILSKLTLGKRSVATLSEESMMSVEGGYTGGPIKTRRCSGYTC
jgi:hypothetical protein